MVPGRFVSGRRKLGMAGREDRDERTAAMYIVEPFEVGRNPSVESLTHRVEPESDQPTKRLVQSRVNATREVKGATLKDVEVDVAARFANVLRGQVRRASWRKEVLGPAGVRTANRADPPVAPGKSGDGLDRIVAIPTLAPAIVDNEIEVALRLEAAAYVLDDNRVPARGEVVRRVHPDLHGRALVIGRSLEQNREGAGRVGQVDVHRQVGAVRHRNPNVALDDYPITLRRAARYLGFIAHRVASCRITSRRSPPRSRRNTGRRSTFPSGPGNSST